MHHQVLNCQSWFLLCRLAAAVVRVVEKRALRGFYQRRLWRALQPQHPRPLSLTDSEVLALQQWVNSLSRQLEEEQQNYNQCLAEVERWNQVTSGTAFGH